MRAQIYLCLYLDKLICQEKSPIPLPNATLGRNAGARTRNQFSFRPQAEKELLSHGIAARYALRGPGLFASRFGSGNAIMQTHNHDAQN